MKKVFLMAAVAVMVALSTNAQVIINSDGTHSVVSGNVVINPDGTHSVISGNVIVNSDGTHSVISGNVVVSSDGTHSVISGNAITDSQKTHSTMHGNVFDNSDNTQSVMPDDGTMSVSQKGIFMDGSRISIAQAKDYCRDVPEAMRHIRMGQAVYGMSFVMASVGGYMLGWQIGNVMVGREVNPGTLAVGVAAIGGAIGLTYVTVGQFRKAEAAYNSATGLDVTLDVAPTLGGLGLRVTF